MNGENYGIEFKCGCVSYDKSRKAVMGEDGKYKIIEIEKIPPELRVWFITDHDEKGIKEQPEHTFLVHECSKIKVYQDIKGMKRYFQKL